MLEIVQLMIFITTLSVLLFIIALILSEDFRRFASRQASRLGKLCIIVFITLAVAVLYAISPIDISPDFIPVFGQCDDILVALISIGIIVLTVLYNIGMISFDISSVGFSKRKVRSIGKPDEPELDK